MEKKLWSEKEIKYLQKYYPTLGYKILADKLNLPFDTVKNKVKALKLRRCNLPNRWTRADIKYLRKNYPLKGAAYVAEKLNRPVMAIRNKAVRMGIKGYTPFEWSNEQVAKLKKIYPKYSVDIVAEKMGRTYDSVVDKACQLKLGRRRKWTKSEEKFLKKNFNLIPLETISEILGFSRKAILDKAYRMKIYKIKNLKWNEKHIAYLKKHYPDRSKSISEIAAYVKHSESGVAGMASKLNLGRYRKMEVIEKKYILSHYKELSDFEMARNLGITADSIRRFCIRIGLKEAPQKKLLNRNKK